MNRIALYPGTFDPPTLGHLDIVERSSKLFEKLYVAVGINDEKNTLFNKEERIQLLKECTANYANVEILSFDGLLVGFAKSLNADAIIRGMRAVSDFEYEFQMALLNRKLVEEVETIFFLPSIQYIYLNSSVVKTIAKFKGDVSQFVSPNVEYALKCKFDK